jgi:hypothetical protein
LYCCEKKFLDAFILGPGIVIIGTGFIFEKISYESHVTYVAGFQKKFKGNRSFVTGSGFEKKKNSYGSKYWLLCVGGFQNKPVFQRKVFAQHFLYKYEVRLDYMLAYSTYLWLWVEDRRGLD